MLLGTDLTKVSQISLASKILLLRIKILTSSLVGEIVQGRVIV